MDKDSLGKEIAAARWELRLASGVPLTPEETEREERRKVIEEYSGLASSISIRTRITLHCQAVWENGAAIKIHPMLAEEPKFYLRPTGDNLRLFRKLPQDGTELLLGTYPRKEERFVHNHVLAAVGDALDQEKHD